MTGRQDAAASSSGDAAVVQLNRLWHAVQEARAAVGRARVLAREVMPKLGRLLRDIRGLPELHVELGDSDAGRAIADALSRRRGMVPATLAAAVLDLPGRPEAYLVGRGKQAVRTGVNHARRDGLSVAYVTDESERRARALELADGKVGADHAVPLTAWAARPVGESWFVVDSSGNTRAIAIFAVADTVARLDTMISAQGHAQSPARYLLSAHVFMELIARGVSHVIAEGSLFLPPGLLHFQRLLGFRQMNLKLWPPHGRPGRLRTSDRRRRRSR